VYGNLKGADKQTARNLVDAIVAELGKDADLAQLYKKWCELQADIKRIYMKNVPAPAALADERELVSIKNMVLRYADKLEENQPTIPHTKPSGLKIAGTSTSARQPLSDISPLASSENHIASNAANAALNLIRQAGIIIESDYEVKLEKYQHLIESKTLRKIIEKKESQGMHQSYE
jgi:hypothetical protein